MSTSYSGEGRRASGEELRDSNSAGGMTDRMIYRWVDAVSVATAAVATSRFSRAGISGEVETRTRAGEAVFQTFSQEVRDLFSIRTSTIRRSQQPHRHQPAPTSHFDLPSAFDSYDTTPNISPLPSPSQETRSSGVPSREPPLAQINAGPSTPRHSRVPLEGPAAPSSAPAERYTRSSSAPGRIAARGFRPVFTAGERTERTLGDIAPGETDAIRSFWAEIGTEERGGWGNEYAYVAVGGGDVGPEGEGEGEDEEGEREYLNELANRNNHRLEYPDITQTSVVLPSWSDVSSSTSSGSSLSSGGLTDWDAATPPPLFMEAGSPAAGVTGWDASAERIEGEVGDADFIQENPLHPLNQNTGLRAFSTLPPVWIDTLAPFVFPTSPTRQVPSIFSISSVPLSLTSSVTPGTLHPLPLTQSQVLGNWAMHNLAEYSRLPSASVSDSTSSTFPHHTGVPWNPTATDSAACPICYENQVTREFPCSIPGAQHGLCGPCFVEYERYCTDVVRCPLCRHEFFGSQVVIRCAVGEERSRGEGEREEEGAGRVGGDERFEVGSELDGEYEVVDEEEIEFYIGGRSL